MITQVQSPPLEGEGGKRPCYLTLLKVGGEVDFLVGNAQFVPYIKTVPLGGL